MVVVDFKKHSFKDKVDGKEIQTELYIRFPKDERTDAGFSVEVLIFSKVDLFGTCEYAYIVPTSEQAGKAITDLSMDGEKNWVHTLVYTDSLDTWLKDSIVVGEHSGVVNGAEAVGKMLAKKKELGITW